MKGFLYILKCSDGYYYTGSTHNLEKRIFEHQIGLASGWTRSRLPVKLVYFYEFNNYHDALFMETRIKGWSRKKKEALMQGKFGLLHELAKCKNESHYKNKVGESER